MRVVVDDREARSGILDSLRALGGLEVVVSRLDAGDYLIGDSVLMERKTFSDFEASLVDGRLFRQACRLVAGPYHPVLLLENDAVVRSDPGVRREALQGAMITLTVLFSIAVLRSRSIDETARLIRYAATQMERSVAGAVRRPGYRPAGRRKRQLFVLQGFPGIGPCRAEKLLTVFGSLRNVFGASPEALLEADGIGKKTARAFCDLLG